MHLSPYLNAILALILVVTLITAAAWIVRKFDTGLLGRRVGGNTRLSLRASLSLDAKRRVVIVACDRSEALILTGPSGDVFLGWVGAQATPDVQPERLR